MACCMSALVAPTMRTFVFCTFEEPTLMNSPVSNTRNRADLGVERKLTTSSGKIVPPFATSK